MSAEPCDATTTISGTDADLGCDLEKGHDGSRHHDAWVSSDGYWTQDPLVFHFLGTEQHVEVWWEDGVPADEPEPRIIAHLAGRPWERVVPDRVLMGQLVYPTSTPTPQWDAPDDMTLKEYRQLVIEDEDQGNGLTIRRIWMPAGGDDHAAE